MTAGKDETLSMDTDRENERACHLLSVSTFNHLIQRSNALKAQDFVLVSNCCFLKGSRVTAASVKNYARVFLDSDAGAFPHSQVLILRYIGCAGAISQNRRVDITPQRIIGSSKFREGSL